MRGIVPAIGLSLLLGLTGTARATTAVIDFNDSKNTTANTKLITTNADGKVTNVTVAGVKAVQTSGKDGTEGYLYLAVQKDLFKNSKAVWARVDYYDQGTDGFRLEYDSTGTADTDAFKAAFPNPRKKFDTRVWTQQTFALAEFGFKGRQPGGSDVRINDLGDGPEIISKVTITDQDPDRVQFTKNNPANPIVIDGVKKAGEWDGAFSVTLDRAAQDAANAANWAGKEDFSGTYSFKWDEKGLYILGDVTDATPRLNDAAPPDYWQGDGLEVFIGLDQSVPNRTSFNPETDFQVLIALGETPRWAVSHGDPSSPPAEDKGAIPAQNLAIVKTDKGYLFELLIPWTLLKPGATVKEGQEIGWTMFANNSKVIGPSDQQVAMSPFGRTKASKNGAGAGPSVWTTAVLSSALSLTTTNPTVTPPAGQ